MSDHLWFIPVAGGGPLVQLPDESLNVQWDFAPYPDGAGIACVNLALSLANWDMPTSPDSACLRNCHASWGWTSHRCVDNIVVGGELAVGTVFARQLPLFIASFPPDNYSTWNEVEVWVKFRVTDTAKLSSIWLQINDDTCLNRLTSIDIHPHVTSNVWKVAYLKKTGSWTGWDSENLRSVITFQGTTAGANAGPVQIDIESFAFRLSDETVGPLP